MSTPRPAPAETLNWDQFAGAVAPRCSGDGAPEQARGEIVRREGQTYLGNQRLRSTARCRTARSSQVMAARYVLALPGLSRGHHGLGMRGKSQMSLLSSFHNEDLWRRKNFSSY